MAYPVEPTQFKKTTFDWDLYDRDFLFSPNGNKEYPKNHCKTTYLESIPFINHKRNAIDIGCRDGEYTRYLHKDFEHVYCFDYRPRKLFHKNVDLSKITHFKCGLAETNKIEFVSGGSSMTSGKRPKENWHKEELFALDQFHLKNIDYIKIDVDGYELNVLKGSIETIKKWQPLIVLEEEKQQTDTIDFCAELGYTIAAWDEHHRNVILRKTL